MFVLDFEEAFKIDTKIANHKSLFWNVASHSISLSISKNKGLCFSLGPSHMTACPEFGVCSSSFLSYTYDNIIFLQAQYKQHDSVYKFIRKLTTLCYLPQEQIQTAFNCLANTVDKENAPKLQELNSVWPIASWTVFIRATRTNNDVEGWHHRLNTDPKAGSGNMGIYTIFSLLFEEASLIPINITLIS
ncbi:hypothetical protein KUTeg_013946 [Tegillarca granosa]|uniref:MULE transposase domain-containing protein n=1 Tax=Tegillarca granosa TaxID=220873 RepID=A0ABQ9EZL6_TEGGR|nr:hypothetical protein KUTeg_013946 [Tegillarca granosa]